MRNQKDKLVAVVVPAHNEEKVIAETLKAILRLVGSQDLYVVDDGSSDKTADISQKYTANVLTLENGGKARALNYAIKYFNLTKNYEYIFFMDADTQPKSNFFKHALPHFSAGEKMPVCVVGRVKTQGKNWISKYRQWEYQISHLIHKNAQSTLKSIVVVPGCATVYRSFIFNSLQIPDGTLTEDMDFTFALHRRGFSNMIFEKNAIVYTQDPLNLKDFAKQLVRWYTGFWQVVRKHNIPWLGQTFDFEVALLATEGLYNGLLVILFMISIIPLATIDALSTFRVPVFLDFFIFFLPTLIWSSIADRDFARIFFIPHFYFLRFLSCLIFLASFFRGYLSVEKRYTWQSRRYQLGKEVS